MNPKIVSLPFAAVLFAAACAPASAQQPTASPVPPPPSGFHVLRKIPLGGEGGWDYVFADVPARRLYVSHSPKVLVLDLDSGNAVGEISGTRGVHGIAVAPELHRGFTSNGGDSTVTIFDTQTLARISDVKTTGENPDAILYDPTSRRVFAFNGRGANATAIDAATGAVAGTIPLGGRPEFAISDGAGHVYVNIEDKNELVEIDPGALEAKHHWSLAPCDEPTGLAMDLRHRRLFAGCHNRLMTIVDADSGKVVTTLPIGEGVDATAFDPELSLAFASNGDGTVTVVREESPDRFRVLENAATQRGARTMALDAKTHRLFLPTAEFGPPPSPTAERPRPRPSIVPGTFTILVVGR